MMCVYRGIRINDVERLRWVVMAYERFDCALKGW